MEYPLHLSWKGGKRCLISSGSAKKWKQQVIPFLAQVLNLKTDNINEDAASMVTDASAAKLGISGGVVVGGLLHGEFVVF